jgi:hypothetical protein
MTFYFAHNGIDHATQAEATAHNFSSSFLVFGIGIAVLIVAALVIARRSSQTSEIEETDEE